MSRASAPQTRTCIAIIGSSCEEANFCEPFAMAFSRAACFFAAALEASFSLRSASFFACDAAFAICFTDGANCAASSRFAMQPRPPERGSVTSSSFASARPSLRSRRSIELARSSRAVFTTSISYGVSTMCTRARNHALRPHRSNRFRASTSIVSSFVSVVCATLRACGGGESGERREQNVTTDERRFFIVFGCNVTVTQSRAEHAAATMK